MKPKANKGEWSELYALLKILSEHEVAAADMKLRPTDERYTFLKIFREDALGLKYIYDLAKDNIVTIRNADGKEVKIVDISMLPEKTKKIFAKMKAGGDQAAFGIDEAEEPMSELLIKKITANSGEKSDIIATIRDHIVQESKAMGFSIKSQIGKPPTLFNPSRKTNFVYRVVGFRGDIAAINAMGNKNKSKIRDRVHAIMDNGGRFEFLRVDGDVFTDNMRIIDTVLPEIMADMLVDYYSGRAGDVKTLSALCGERAPHGLSETAILFKVKSFLRAIALGMVPGHKWNALLAAYGGYIVVREDGLLVCYSLHNDDEFKDYLFENTKFDTPSTSRHRFGTLFYEDGQLLIKLNLQIRFIK